MTDSRKYPRGHTDGYLVVYDERTGLPLGRLRNLTVEGAMLICTEPVDTPSILHCRMTLPDIIEGLRDLSFKIEGKWCEENQRAGWFELGCAFVDLTDQDEKIIKQLMNEWMTIADTTDTICRGTIPR